MKKIIYLIPLFIALSCGPKSDGLLTASEIDQIKAEIQPSIDQIIQGSTNADFAKAIEPYADSKDFIGVSNGQLSDYATMAGAAKQAFAGFQGQQFTPTRSEVLVLSRESAVFTFLSTVKITLKDSTQIVINPFVASLIFKKMEGNWKVIYSNEFSKVVPVDGLE